MRRSQVLLVALAVAAAVAALGLAASRRSSPGNDGASSRRSDPAVRLVTIEVGGMVCAGCVAKVQDQLGRVPGVRRIEVSLSGQRAQVLCDPTVADTSLTRAVRRAGSEFVGMVTSR